LRSSPKQIGLLLILLLALPAALLAHGGGTPQLVNEPAGPYWISVWTTPDPARVGEFHLTLGISEPGEGREAGPPVLGADVQVSLEPGAGTAADVVTTTATNEQSTNKLFYEADVSIPVEGSWQVAIAVDSPAGQGSASFPLEVEPRQSTNWLLLGGGGVVLVVVLFALFSWRREK
jgi:hypothetical protein